MAVPDYQTLMKPVLELAVTEQKYSEAVQAIGNQFNLTDEDRAEATSKGTNILDNRVAWALTYLVKAGLIERPRRGYFYITDTGRDALDGSPKIINNQFLSQFAAFNTFRGAAGNTPEINLKEQTLDIAVATPGEQIDRAFIEIEDGLKSELLDRILQLPPKFFEDLVVTLVHTMGYGDKGTLSQATGGVGDGGIDGIIHQDKLGLDVVYLQAKRYAPGNSVGRPELQAFIGTLAGVSAQKGVFVTTSHFSNGALNYLETVQQRVITIDGDRLVQLMIENGVGVKTKQVYEVRRIDEDFFSD